MDETFPPDRRCRLSFPDSGRNIECCFLNAIAIELNQGLCFWKLSLLLDSSACIIQFIRWIAKLPYFYFSSPNSCDFLNKSVVFLFILSAYFHLKSIVKPCNDTELGEQLFNLFNRLIGFSGAKWYQDSISLYRIVNCWLLNPEKLQNCSEMTSGIRPNKGRSGSAT